MASLELEQNKISIGFNNNAYTFDGGNPTLTQTIDKNPNWTIDKIYPVGSIYFSTTEISPTKYFGGTWIDFGLGRCLVCVDRNSDENNFRNTCRRSGAETVTLTTNQIPSHRHQEDKKANAFSHPGGSYDIARSYSTTYTKTLASTDGGGSGGAHNNLQPYYTCYMWLRIA